MRRSLHSDYRLASAFSGNERCGNDPELAKGAIYMTEEAKIVQHEIGVDRASAEALVALARRLRALRDRGLAEVPSTRLLVATAGLVASGIEPRAACYAGLLAPLSDDPSLLAVMRDLANAAFV